MSGRRSTHVCTVGFNDNFSKLITDSKQTWRRVIGCGTSMVNSLLVSKTISRNRLPNGDVHIIFHLTYYKIAKIDPCMPTIGTIQRYLCISVQLQI